MTERVTRELGAVSASPGGLLAIPTDDSTHENRRLSTSSNVTIVENRVDDPEFKPVARRQTFKISRKLSLWEWFTGIFDREALIKKIEKTIEVVHAQGPRDRMIPDSEYIVDVLVSPKINSTKYQSARCLLDTGCLKGNLVTRELVTRLGYVESDFQQATSYESHDAKTLTGEPLHIEAAILLSWHHKSNPDIRDLKLKLADLEAVVENYVHFLDMEKKKHAAKQNKKEIARIESKLPKKRHEIIIKGYELDVKKAEKDGKHAAAQKFKALARKEQEDWEEKYHPKKATTPASSTTDATEEAAKTP
ncbi:hypothetical protein N0V94_005312 [Neodidymelliopsis sp. IMI 364377]|nr:hypothetical protein N0V94_005312 [Neodidymelliopsis sp. IMI 364377]